MDLPYYDAGVRKLQVCASAIQHSYERGPTRQFRVHSEYVAKKNSQVNVRCNIQVSICLGSCSLNSGYIGSQAFRPENLKGVSHPIICLAWCGRAILDANRFVDNNHST